MNALTKDAEFYNRLWKRLSGTEFSVQQLVERVRADGGHDITNLSEADLVSLAEGLFSGDWKEAAFSFSELLAYYAALGEKRTKQQVVGWVFASFVIADAINESAADWELQFNSFIDGFLAIRGELETEEAVQVFRRVFNCDGTNLG